MSIWRRLADAATMFVVSFVCLVLLIFVAHGTATRTNEQLLVEKLVAQAQLVQSAMETYLRPGLPLRQFTGFHQITDQMVKVDLLLDGMVVLDTDGDKVFIAGNVANRTLPPTDEVAVANGTAKMRTSSRDLQIILPLRNKFERVGDLVVTMDRNQSSHLVERAFLPAVIIAALASVIFSTVVFASAGSPPTQRKRRVAFAFTLTFLAVAAAVVLTMITVFSDAAQSKGRALADSLGQRLDDIFVYGLLLEQIDGLDEVLADYRRLNPDISAVGITVKDRVAVHTDHALIGRYWSSDPANYEYQVSLTHEGHPRPVQVVLALPKSIVYWQVARSVKNFAALFIASAFFAFLFMQVAHAMQQARGDNKRVDWRSSAALELIKPSFFLAVLADHLSYAFLPQLVSQIVDKSGLPAGYVAVPFMAYYLCFALALMPAGRYELRFGCRPLVLGGLILTTGGLLAMALLPEFHLVVMARAVGGVGQGMLFIGLQSYVLNNAVREHRTKANAIIVFGFQAGMISGMAIGSLLVGQIGPIGVFLLAALISALVFLYTMTVLPKEQMPRATTGPTSREIWREIGLMLRDLQFVKSFLLIGVPAKAVLTGVVLFAMPLLLHARGVAQEDIGQITMIYAACVIFSSTCVASIADRTNGTKTILVWGALLTAVGLLTIAASAADAVTQNPHATVLATLLAVGGIALVGVAHGLINAPVVTHVTETLVASRIGTGPVAAAYRFLERAGHTLGPIVMGQLFLHLGPTPLTLIWVAAGVAVLGLIFSLPTRGSASPNLREEYAQ
jgi:predicted MFS family arabinose efflux permease